jgi:osmotically-inducible protein OsmY
MNSQSRMPAHPLRKILITFAAAAFAALLTGCAGTPNQESTGEYFDNSVITAKVKTALLNAEDLRSGEISVASFRGGVQLSGFVPTETDKRRAEVITRDVDGVKSVTNSIQIKGQ